LKAAVYHGPHNIKIEDIHWFKLEEFELAFQTVDNPDEKALKVIITK